ncbi:MAG: cell division protein ZapA [Flavobacterium sp.]|uniref:cell division protein ZapA n=1 Tax=Myroides sp. N17-2 TaxID=2030799 RepID=UPI000EFDA717|nr:cell division protein ZapA [Myroides sp. N17-2]
MSQKDEQLKIKLSIADRVYPLTVAYSQEEGLRSASKKIDLMIHQFEENYAVRDKQDVLAMCALQFASQNEQKTIDTTDSYNKSVERLIRLDEALDRVLSKKI